MAPADNWKRAQLDDSFWAEQFAGLQDPHVAPINELVDRLSHAKGAVRLPHAAPWHGGIHAPVLSVLNDPGEKTLVPDFLCLRNPDRASDRQRHLMTEFDINPSDFCPWNGYPWPRENKKDLTPGEALEGGRALLEIMSLMTNLRLLLLLGRKARDAADAVLPELTASYPHLEVVRSLHPLGAKSTVHRQEQKVVWANVATLIKQGMA
ncbi:hypothetical protein [Paeniglutamicibacter kerguelensis]|uniref:Uracil-DNA glycosylase n=1 Tax=Paeniglutamicibacter kerguelensis TaxID=254788 RepID=A0ABS4XB52_9MICC|nr:hypothetical protein [Paeniglutamicibacter kerguelensis]MBP2385693.1 hypothetical protein [Paeniglutamicibacter kerguelensis]